ncbi:oligosaccharyl transferase alpha subunit [Pholiota molesta]|nr:oligosaccharyl transferase alpha subunit [Pholiota molesta]
MMPNRWRSLPLLLLVNSVFASSQSFENSAVVRSIELGGAAVHVTTTYAIKPLEAGLKSYSIALGREEKKKTSWLEVKSKGEVDALQITERPFDASKDFHLVDVQLPVAYPVNKTFNLILETVQTHATHPWPETAGQNEEQALKYSTDLFVISPYTTSIQRTKVKSLTPHVEGFAKDSVVSKSGATVTYGPFENVPPSTEASFLENHQQPITVHYYHDQPCLEITKLERFAEISHWGANLNIEDKIVLHNAGPKLKGHFSRLDHQTQAFYKRPASHVLPALTLHLPAGIRNTYYYDTIGNVSTSKLRVAPSTPKNKQKQYSYDKKTGRYIVEIPIMTPILGAVIDEEDLTIILPEGATDVQYAAPFPALSNTVGTQVTYLDTIGRPSLTFKYKDLTVRHAESIFVSYKVSWSAHLKKPIAVGTAFLGLFTLSMIARRVNLTLHQQKPKAS